MVQAFFLKRNVPNGQYLVNEQNLGFHMGRHRKSQADVHTARVTLHGSVQELLDLGKSNDLVELSFNFAAPHAENGAAQVNVFAARQLGMKSGSNFKQAPDAPKEFHEPSGGLGYARKYFEQRRFSRAIAAHQSKHLAW